MPECVGCSTPVARRGTFCNACEMERAFGVPEDHIEDSQKKAKEAGD